MILLRNGSIYSTNERMSDFFSINKDVNCHYSIGRNLELFQSFSAILEHILLHLNSKTFIVSGETDSGIKICLSRKSPIIAPSGKLIGVEIQLIPMSVVMGAVGYFQSKFFYQTNDIAVTLRESIGGWEFSDLQSSYLFFIVRNFSEGGLAEIFGVKRTSARSCIERIKVKMEAKLGCKIDGLDGIRKACFEHGLHCMLPKGMFPVQRCIELHFDLDDWYEVRL
ncbi:hypothetical protein [Vibrio coralliirubri]|uniref:hypothetical protein n=1 Tax=Vibrio coralliirubri TaxID=1516159 RepID=UPI0012E002DC|nr:hypothetical protein [Vibrio coralliirubri]